MIASLPKETREAREIFIHAGRIVVRARLLETPLADAMWARLPCYGAAEVENGCIRLATVAVPPVPARPHSDALVSLAVGEIGLNAATNHVHICVCRLHGSQRVSTAASGYLATEARYQVFARILDDIGVLAQIEPGRAIALLEAAS